MANEEQLSILKQGVSVWNKWRDENPRVKVDLRRALLAGVKLGGVNLREADLGGAILDGADLRGAQLNLAELIWANLVGTDLRDANLNGAKLSLADLDRADLRQADLKAALLMRTNLRWAFLTGANLSGSKLNETNLNGADLYEAHFSLAGMGSTNLGAVDLSKTIGLEEVLHDAPSQISTDTLALSKGKIPENFLRGCGLSDADIEYAKLSNPELSNDELNKILYKIYDLRATQALQIYPLFISYNHTDSEFIDKIGSSLTEKGIRYWRDLHDMKAGRMEEQIDRAIHQNPTMLLVLSRHSLSSDWVEHEVRTARGLEKETRRDVLCPVALDDSWKSSRWPKRIMEQIMEYNILDFSEWEDDVKFEGMFRKLIDGLQLFYKG